MIQIVKRSNIPNTFEIKQVFECKRCAETCPVGILLNDYQRITVGLTPYGFQVWCTRHQLNVVHFDFRGQKIPVNASVTKGVIWPAIH